MNLSFINRFFVDHIFVPAMKLSDKINDRFDVYLPPDPILEEVDLEAKEREAYADFCARIDPSGIYAYAWDVKTLVNDGYYLPDIGDRCLFQGLALAIASLKGDKDTLELLLRGAERFFRDDCLLRGIGYYCKRNNVWEFNGERVAGNVSGDQLAGIIFGLSMAYHLHPELFTDTLKQEILSFTNRMIIDNMRLYDIVNNKFSKRELSYKFPFLIDQSPATKLALLSLANSIDIKNKKVGDVVKYHSKYCELVYKYNLDKLAQYQSAYLLHWNNYFGMHISAIALFSIGLNMGFPEYVKDGLKRIAWQTRKWGYSLYALLSMYANKDKICALPHDIIISNLKSYFIKSGSDLFGRNILGKTVRIKPLSIASRNADDYPPQRGLIDYEDKDVNDKWELEIFGNTGFLLEYWLYKINNNSVIYNFKKEVLCQRNIK